MIDIDRVARQLTETQPTAGLEARIRARLDAEAPRVQHRAWTRWALVGGLAGAAAMVAVGVLGPGSRGPEVQVSRGPEVQVSRSPEVQVSRGPEVQVSRGPEVQVSRDPEVQAVTLSSAELAWMERRIPALEAVTALQVDQLAYESIQPEALSIAPLTMTALPTSSAEVERQDHQ
jgi:hypothetical protein